MDVLIHLGKLAALATILVAPFPLIVTVDRRGRLPTATPSERFLGIALGWIVIQVATAVALGLVGRLELGPVLAVSAVLVTVGLSLAWSAAQPPAVPSSARKSALTAKERLVVIVTLVLGMTLLLRCLATTVVDVDSLDYHLPAVAHWYQTGTLAPPERPDEIAYYPYGWELLSLLFVLPFGDDFAVTVPNFIAWCLLGLAVYRVARELGAERLPGMVGSLGLLCVPLVRHQLGTLHIDVALSAFLTAAVASMLALVRTRATADATALGAALAMAAAVKIPGLVYDTSLLLIAVATGLVVVPRHGSRQALLLLAPAVVVASVWYVRNLVQVGNPLGLVQVRVAGVTLLQGRLTPERLRSSSLLALFHPADPAHWKIVLDILAVRLGLPFAALTAAAIVATFRASKAEKRGRLVVVLFAVVCLMLYTATPFSGDSGASGRLTPWMAENLRYALPFVAMVGTLGALGIELLLPAAMQVAGAVAVAAGAVNSWLPVAAVAVAAVGSLALALRRIGPIAASFLVTGAAVAGVAGTASLRAMHANARTAQYGATWKLMARCLASDEPVGVLSSHDRFLLYGRDLRGDVRDAAARTDDRPSWVKTLESQGIHVVAVGPTEQLRPELPWLDDPSGPFERICGEDPDRDLVLYRLRPAAK